MPGEVNFDGGKQVNNQPQPTTNRSVDNRKNEKEKVDGAIREYFNGSHADTLANVSKRLEGIKKEYGEERETKQPKQPTVFEHMRDQEKLTQEMINKYKKEVEQQRMLDELKRDIP